jgi:hypothetical protein
MFSVIFFAPVVETILFQLFPIWVVRLGNARFSIQVVASLIPFFLAHLSEGIAAGISAGLVGGFYLAFTYAHWCEKSKLTAFWVTAVAHFIHNAIVLLLVFALNFVGW